MKYLILCALILAAPVQAQSFTAPAESQKDPRKTYILAERKMYCFLLSDVWKAAKEIEQEIVWVGRDAEGQNYALLVSKKDKHFTIVNFKDTLGCVLGGGNDFAYGNAFEKK